MESWRFSDTLHRFPSFSKTQLLPIPIPRGHNLPISSIHRRSFSPAAAVEMDSKEKLWGGRFEDSVADTVETLAESISFDKDPYKHEFEDSVADTVETLAESISFDKDPYKHDIMGSRAHASMLHRQGLITEDDKNCILKGLDEIDGQIERGEFVSRFDKEDVYMNTEAAPTDLVAEPAKNFHTGRSRNHQLALKNEGLRLILPGYARLQSAQPVLQQHPVRAFFEQLARDAGRLLDCSKRMKFFPLGACAFAGTGLPIDRFLNPEALGSIGPTRTRPNKDNDEGSCGEERGGNGKWTRTLARVGIVIRGGACFYLMYKTGQAIEREIVGAVRDWKEAGFPALVNVKIEKVSLKFSIY